MKQISLIFYANLVVLFCTHTLYGEGDLFQYDPKGKRDPFLPVLSEAALLEQSQTDISGKLSRLKKVEIQGILWDPESPLVMIGDEILEVGSTLMGATIKEIMKNEVVFELEGEQVTIKVIDEELPFDSPTIGGGRPVQK